jgi:FixJ family two-component response regulator
LAFKHPKALSCLILDIRLPNINGFALQEIMCQRGMITPIVFITGHGNIPMTVKAMKAGAVDFLSKPFTSKELLNAITLALSKSKVLNKKQTEIAKIKQRIDTLSPRELEVFHLVAQGLMNKNIASKRGISLQTIKIHRGRVMQKMQAKTVTELIGLAQKAGIISSS